MPKCPKDCNKPNCVFFRKATVPAAMRNDEIDPPQNGDFCNMLVVYEATGNVYLFPSDGVPVLLSATNYELLDNLPSINGVTLLGDLTLEDLGISQLVEEEAEERKTADSILQRQIDAITASSDVVDIVGTYEELEEYDTSRLHENDIIKVLADETIGGATAYYRWVDGQWEYIGEEGPYYTKNETDALLDQKMDISTLDDYYTKTETDTLLNGKADVSALAGKQDKLVAGANITIDQATNVISATVPSLTNYYTKQETYSQAEVDSLISGVEADIPTATSQLTNDSGFLTTLPIATDQILGGIKVGSGLSVTSDGTLSATGTSIAVDSALSTTSTNPVENRVITNALNNKANITDIPTVPTNVSAFYNDAGYVTSSTIAQNYYNKTETYNQTEVDSLISGVSADIPTKTSDLTNDGATGTSTYVELNQLAPVATSGSYNDLTDKPTVMTGLVEMSYGEANAWAKFIAAYQAKQIVYCRASSAANPASGSQTRKAFMAYVNNATNPTSVEFQYVRSVSSKTASQPVDQVFVYTLTSANGGTWTVTTRDMGPKLAQGTNTTVSYSNGTYTISATQPTVPTKTSDLTNDGSDGTSTYVEADQLATVATSGSYNDLSNKPTIPAAQVNSDWNASSGVAQILNKPTLATVATSGSYNDLSNKPNIPTVNNATLTIQRNGTNVQTFTANQSTNVTANIVVPTKTSDLMNDGADGDSSYVTETDIAPAELGGEGSAIYIEGTTDCSAIDTAILGNIEQTTYTGKNLWGGFANDFSKSSSGITFVTKTDGTITNTAGTTSATAYSAFASEATNNGLTKTLEAGTYCISGASGNITLDVCDTSGTTLVTDSGNGATFTLSAQKTVFVRIRVASGKTLTAGTTKPLLESGNQPTTYEPYVGGIPAPNPSYPQPIETVTGRQTVGIVGKNLYDPNSTVFSIPSNVSIEVDGNSVKVTTLVNTTSNDLFWRTPIPDAMLENGKAYTASCVLGGGAYRSLKLQLRNHDGTYAGLSNGYTITYDSNYTLFVVENPFAPTTATQVSAGTTCTISNIQVEEGSTATAFEPFNGQNYEINLGKNLFDKDNPNVVRGYIAGTNLTGGTDYTIYIPCEENTTYTIQKMVAVPQTANRFRINSYATEPTAGSTSISSSYFWNAGDGSATTTHTYTTPTGAKYLGITVMTANTSGTTTADEMYASIQIEKGSIASSYSAYFTPIELCKIVESSTTYQDRIYKDNGKWYLYKEIGKITFTSSTAWTKHGTTNGNVFMLSNTGFIGYPYNSGHVTPALMDTDKAIELGSMPDSANGVFGVNTGSQLRVFRGTYDANYTADTFKAEMVGHYIYGALATPTTTEITNEEILKGLAELDDAHGYEPITNVTVSTPNTVPALLSVSTYAGGAIPAATNNRPGVVMIGDGLIVDECGKVSSGYYPIDIDVGYDSDFYSWSGASLELLGPIISIATDSLGEYRNQICGIAIPNATFTRRDNGQSLSVEEVYDLVDGDARVRLYNLPFIHATYSTGGGALSSWENLGKLGRIELSAKVEWELTDEWTEYGTRYGGDAPTTMACNLGAYIERREVVGNDPEYAIYLKFIRQYRP